MNRHLVPYLLAAVALIVASGFGGLLQSAQAVSPSKATCHAIPMVAPAGADKAAVKIAALVDDLHAGGATTVQFGAMYVCGW
jgi:hypothetical protein